jgi:hypothetical protein
MRKLITAGMAIAMLAIIPAAASADVPRCQDTVSEAATATFNATQPSGGGGNWVHHFNVTVNPDHTFTGTNVITGLDAGQMTTVNETVTGSITDKNADGTNEITVSAVRDSGFYTFKWSVTDAPMNGAIDSMDVGTVSYVTAENWNGGSLPITFTAPVFTYAPTTDMNHGQYVKSQGGGSVAAQKCAGMPLVSKQGK